MLVILVRGIDLSIAANLALCGMLAALFNRAFPGAGVAPVLALTLVTGAARRLQWPAGLEAAAAAHRGHARHHVHLPRRHLPAVAGRMGQRERDVARLPRVSARASSWASRCCRGWRWRLPRLRGCAAALARGARSLRGRRQPRGGKLLRHRSRAHAVHRVHALRRHRRACAATCGWRDSRWHTPTLRSASSCQVIAACLIGGVAIAGGVGIGRGRGARLPVHRHHPQQPAAGRHLARSGRCSSTAWSSWSPCC